MTKNKWKEIKISHLDETDQFWRVDAWLTASDDEPGEVIAYIDDLTGRVLYNDPVARVDEYAQQVIQEKLEEIKSPVTIEKSRGGLFSISIHTKFGDLLAEAEPSEDEDSEDNIYIGLLASDSPHVYVDLAGVRMKNNGDVVITTWDDVTDEDYQHRFEIQRSEIDEIVDSAELPF